MVHLPSTGAFVDTPNLANEASSSKFSYVPLVDIATGLEHFVSIINCQFIFLVQRLLLGAFCHPRLPDLPGVRGWATLALGVSAPVQHLS